MRKGLTGNIKHSSGMKWSQQKLNEYKLLRRRKVFPGYPIKKIFQTKKEVDEYFSGDRIVCLLCGRSLKMLNAHLKIHGFAADQYREEYGLPYSRGLAGEATKELCSIHFKNLVKQGIIGKPTEETIKKMHDNSKNQRFQPYRRNVAIENVSKTKLISKKNLKPNREKGNYVYWENSEYYKILSLSIEYSLHPHDIIIKFKNTVPSLSLFRRFKIENPDFKEKYYETVDSLPFLEQAKHDMLGNRFVNELKKLKELNYSNKKISEIIGVHEVTIEKYTSKNNIKRPEKTHCVNGHLYPDGKRKCKICNTEYSRKRLGTMDRNISKTIKVIVQCSLCGENVETNRLGKSRKLYCVQCKNKKYYESQKKYAEKNIERRKQMNKVSRLKRIEKQQNKSR